MIMHFCTHNTYILVMLLLIKLRLTDIMTPAGDSAVLSGVKKVILVLSGKGGVGKSTVSVQLALAHQLQGLKVGLLDIDLCGPSIPRMLGLHGQEVHQSEAGWCPVFTDNTQTLAVMSIGFLLTNQVC